MNPELPGASPPDPVEALEVYEVGVEGVPARGVVYADDLLDAELRERVISILWDAPGTQDLEDVLAEVPSTEFEEQRLNEVLSSEPILENWRVGEALGESYLVHQRSCEFPWPMGRDLRNPAGSPSGADLVGFSYADGTVRFAFGEVKTSSEESWPPNVMYSRTGLIAQIEALRDSVAAKDHLMRYLGFHAVNAPWRATYQGASQRYLADPDDVALHGVLVRDVEPREDDLRARTRVLANGRRDPTSIELRAQYLPSGCLETIVERVLTLRSGL